MSDGFDKVKKVFEQEPAIKASDPAKKVAMQLAMQAFEKQHENKAEEVISKESKEKTKKSENNFQGNVNSTRQKKEDRNKAGLFNFFEGSEFMNFSTIAVLVVIIGVLAAAVGPGVLDNKNSNYSGDRKETAEYAPPSMSKPVISELPMEESVSDTRIVGMAAKPQRNVVAKMAPAKPSMGLESASIAFSPSPSDVILRPPEPVGNDKFEKIETSPLKLTKEESVSTFSIDVDTASYSFMRSSLNQGRLPQKDAIRVEELINYFSYDYPLPEDVEQPFNVSTTVMPTPWNENTKLLHIGIKGYELPKQDNPKSNLVFLLDTSGSMSQPNKLPLLINSFKLLLSTLKDDDIVSIVAYAGSAGTVLEPTKVKEKAKIIQALERLRAGGSTAGGQGIRLAYQLAEANYDKDAVNRVLLATDGDFNVGIRNPEELKSFIERKRETGVYLSVLGFGQGNYNDQLMQKLAQNGNGNAAYIDSLSEARKVLVEEASSTLFTIAKDVKIQMEFNPLAVSEYRLIGYETRKLNREDFNNDKVDAGEIGAGHTVTAIYEITPTDSAQKMVDPLRYGQEKEQLVESKPQMTASQSEYGFLKLRYKLPDEDKSKLIETPIQIADAAKDIESTSIETRFATSVAAFGQLLRGGKYTASFNYDDVIDLAFKAKGDDYYGYRAEFITLVRLAKTMQPTNQKFSREAFDLNKIKKEILIDPIKLTDIVRITPVVIDDTFIGFRIRPGENRRAFRSLNFRPHDVVIEINGIAMSPEKSINIQLLDELKNATDLSIKVRRGKQEITIDHSFENK